MKDLSKKNLPQVRLYSCKVRASLQICMFLMMAVIWLKFHVYIDFTNGGIMVEYFMFMSNI